MGLLARLLNVPTAVEVARVLAPETAKPIIENLDKYHQEWAGFNREIEGRVKKLEQLDEALRLQELRIQTLEQDRNKLRIDCEEMLEQVARLMNRLRMRAVRESTGEEPPEEDRHQMLLLERKAR